MEGRAHTMKGSGTQVVPLPPVIFARPSYF